MRRLLWLAALILGQAWFCNASADYLVVSHSAHLHSQPDSDSESLLHVQAGTELRLLEQNKTNEYYHAEPYTGGSAGWIYKTLVRRYAGDPPGLPTPGGGTGGSPGAGGVETGTGVDVSAYAIPNCDASGYVSSAQWIKDLNKLKNRVRGPAPSRVHPLAISAILAPGPDQTRWSID